MRYVMGVDGGGSKTYTVIVDENGNKVGDGLAAGANHQSVGIDQALTHIQASIDQALQQARLQAGDIDFVQYGLAGADREKDYAILRPALATLPFRAWDVVCDTEEGLRTGSPDNVGVVLVCGTATNAAGRNPDGDFIQTGGFGYAFGDAAGGGYMARQTFRLAIRSWEQREVPSRLTAKVAAYFGFPSMEDVFHHFLDHDIADVPTDLTLVLHEAADEGDALAIQLLEHVGTELGFAANSVIRRLGGFEQACIPIILIGSIVQEGRNNYLLQALEQTVAREQSSFTIVIPEMAPVYGAVLLALDHLQIAVSNDIYDKFIGYGGHSHA